MTDKAQSESVHGFADVEMLVRRHWMVLIAVHIPGPLILAHFCVPLGPRAAVVMMAVGYALFGALLVGYRKLPIRKCGELRVDGRGMILAGQLVVRRSSVRQALVFADGDQQVVRVTTRSAGACDFRVSTVQEAERLLAALGHGEEQTTATFACAYGGSVSPLAIIVAAGAVALSCALLGIVLRLPQGGLFPAALGLPAGAAVFGLGALLWRSSRVTVGADGIAVRRALRKDHYVPFAEIAGVRRHESDVVVELRQGKKPMRLGGATGNRRLAGIDADAPALALLRRIEDAREHASTGARVPARALLARGDTTREAWRQRIDRLGEDAVSYRAPSLPTEELWNVLGDAREASDVRAAAAIALRAKLDGAGRERVRIAASTSAEAPLRRVFTAVNEGKNDELEEALDELEPVRRRAL